MIKEKVRVGIMGAAGYTGGELIRLLIHHPAVELVFAHSKSSAPKYIYEVHKDLLGDCALRFTDTIVQDIDVLFLCMGHGASLAFLQETVLDASLRIVDLSADFRIEPQHVFEGKSFVYGLTEWNREAIREARYIANPGCFATAIQLGILPLVQQYALTEDIHVTATTGSTGAGQFLSQTAHFSWRQNNLSVYKAFEHQHLREIGQSVQKLKPDFAHKVRMIPNRGAFTRGILASIYTTCNLSLEEAYALFDAAYKDQSFVHVSRQPIDLKQVVNTNKCLVYLEKHDDQLLIVSIIDNLLKGASGQALQNMNIMMGLEETSGLQLKASAF